MRHVPRPSNIVIVKIDDRSFDELRQRWPWPRSLHGLLIEHLHAAHPASFFRGKIAVIGVTAPSLQDVHATPVNGSDLMSGAEVEANTIWTAIHGNPLKSAPGWLALLAVVLAALAAPLAALRLGVFRTGIAAVVVALAYTLAVQLAFDSGWVVSLIFPLLALTLGAAGMIAASYRVASADRRLLGRAVHRRTEQLRDSQIEIITRLAQAANSRDSETRRHTERIGHLCERLALTLGFGPARAQMLRYASAMHDVGKVGISDRVLLKPGSLDAEEWKIMRSHTTKGAEILSGSSSPLIQMAETIARTHEHCDVRGTRTA